MKIYCINLKRSTERRAKMEAEFIRVGVENTFIDAVDGRTLCLRERGLGYSAWRTRFRNGIGLTPNEVGCALSHKKFFESVLSDPSGVGLVLEDDVSLGEEFGEVVREVELFLLAVDEPAIVQLPGLKRDLRINGSERFVKVNTAMGAYAYAINRAAAELLIKAYTPIKMPSDKYGYLIRHLGLNFYVYSRVALSVDMECKSDVGSGRVHYSGMRMLLFKVWRCLGLLVDAVLSFEEWR